MPGGPARRRISPLLTWPARRPAAAGAGARGRRRAGAACEPGGAARIHGAGKTWARGACRAGLHCAGQGRARLGRALLLWVMAGESHSVALPPLPPSPLVQFDDEADVAAVWHEVWEESTASSGAGLRLHMGEVAAVSGRGFDLKSAWQGGGRPELQRPSGRCGARRAASGVVHCAASWAPLPTAHCLLTHTHCTPPPCLTASTADCRGPAVGAVGPQEVGGGGAAAGVPGGRRRAGAALGAPAGGPPKGAPLGRRAAPLGPGRGRAAGAEGSAACCRSAARAPAAAGLAPAARQPHLRPPVYCLPAPAALAPCRRPRAASGRARSLC